MTARPLGARDGVRPDRPERTVTRSGRPLPYAGRWPVGYLHLTEEALGTIAATCFFSHSTRTP